LQSGLPHAGLSYEPAGRPQPGTLFWRSLQRPAPLYPPGGSPAWGQAHCDRWLWSNPGRAAGGHCRSQSRSDRSTALRIKPTLPGLIPPPVLHFRCSRPSLCPRRPPPPPNLECKNALRTIPLLRFQSCPALGAHPFPLSALGTLDTLLKHLVR
jgi:hypothetical protein